MADTHSTYLSLCTQVYDISKPTPPQDEYEFYRSYAVNANGKILEPMCGTGRFLLPMSSEGFNIYGFDASTHMLDALHAKANDKKLKVNVWQACIEDTQPLDNQYQLIFVPSGSFDLIFDLKNAQDALAKIYHHLANDGIFVFEVITPSWKASQVNVWTGDVWYRNDGKYILLNCFTLPDKDYIRHSIARYELVDGHHIIQTEIEDFKVRLYEPEQVIDMLKQAGFSEIKIIKAYDRNSQPDKNDEVIIVECKK